MLATLCVLGLAFLHVVHSFPSRSPVLRDVETKPKTITGTTSATAAGPFVSVTLSGQTYVNKGMVGFGLIPSNAKDSTGDTIGGIGSAILIKHGTWAAHSDGTYSGTFVVHPDRGFNVNGTIDYQARSHDIDFVFSPYTGRANLSFADAQKTLNLTYISTTLQFERNHTKTSGLDGLGVRPKQVKSASTPLPDPEMPIPDPSLKENHLVLDVEGIVQNVDGSFWISDEYGPYIYLFSANGNLIQTIQPPEAILPLDDDGNLNFTSAVDPTTGRGGNHGFESLTLDPSTLHLYAMLQEATIQDGGDKSKNARYTRLLAWDVSDLTVSPPLKGEWVVPLQLDGNGKTLDCNEISFIGNGVFLALSRDSNGHGGDATLSTYKQIDLFDISKATDISGSKFDDPSNPIAKKGTLNSGITPATYVGFVNMINGTGLARFGLHNGDPADQTLIDAKWESLAVAPVMEAEFPHDFFVFTAADNDFISTQGVALGQPFNAGLDNDNQFMVFRVTLPNVSVVDFEMLLKR